MVDQAIKTLACMLGVFGFVAACSSDHGGATGGDAGSANRGGSGSAAAGRPASAGDAGSDEANASGKTGSAGSDGMPDTGGPAPMSAWVNATGNLANLPSECGNLTLLSAVPGSSTVIAGVAKKGLWATTDSGKTWAALGSGSGSAVITNRPSSVVYDPEHEGTFYESGIYNDGGLYKTVDAGKTFTQLGDVRHSDLVSVDFSDPDRKTIVAGGHEQKQVLYLSTDAGQSFSQIGQNLPKDAHFSSEPLVLDSKTFLVGACGYGDGACGVYRSGDAGKTWSRASDLATTGRPLWASDGTIYWPLIYNSGLARGSADGTSWTKVADGIVTFPPVELPDGRILTVQGDHVAVSADKGMTWMAIGDKLPFQPNGVVYSVPSKTLFIWQWDCGEVVLPNAIASAGFDYR